MKGQKHTTDHDQWDAGGYCNALVTDDEGYGEVCGYRKPPATPEPVPTPELDKMKAVQAESQAIGEFIEHGGYVLAKYVKLEGARNETLVPVQRPITQILADYFEIDLNKVEEERRAVMERFLEGS